MASKRYAYYDGKAVPRDERLDRVEVLANWLDARWVIPGTRWRIGLDGILGLVPGIGDTITTLISTYILYEAHRLGAPGHIKLRMLANIFIDWLVGSIPLFGDIFDVAWKANLRNARLLREYLARRG